MRSALKAVLSMAVDFWARASRFFFPSKYSWRWKWDMLSGAYEPETGRLVRDIVSEGMCVIDIGAHIGYFTRLFSKKVGAGGSVYAFEPDQENIELLRKNTAHLSNVRVFSDALSSREGQIFFYHIDGSTGCHTTVANLAENSEKKTVHATTLDAFIAHERVTRIDLIKMDIEGGEWDALEGMGETLRRYSPAMICEYNPGALSHSGKSAPALLDLFDALGYSINAITRTGTMELAKPYGESIAPHLANKESINIYCKKKS